jgi:hypothetical protein
MCIISSFALELELKPENTPTISNVETEAMVSIFKQRRYTVESKEAKKHALENRKLANYYLKNEALSADLKAEFTLLIEEKLATLVTQNNIPDPSIKDDVILSYYTTHKKQFENSKIVEIIAVPFDSLEEAFSFYTTNKDKPFQKIETTVSGTQRTFEKAPLELAKLHPIIKSSLKGIEEMNYLLPPLYINKKHTVMYIGEIKEGGFKPLEEVRSSIVTTLKDAMSKETRALLLENLKEAQR